MKNLDDLDIFDDAVDRLSIEEEDIMLELSKKNHRNPPTTPCACFFCNNWIENTELYHIIGFGDYNIICISCAK